MNDLEIKVREEEELLIVSAHGEIKPGNETEFSQALDRIFTGLLENRKSTILDFNGLDYINSTGLGVIAQFYRKCREDNLRVVICNLNTMCAKLFEITKLDQIFSITPSVEDARMELAAES